MGREFIAPLRHFGYKIDKKLHNNQNNMSY